jgi:hypothetical protein
LAGYQLCIVYDSFEGIHVMRDFGVEEHFYMSGLEANLYKAVFQPVSMEYIKKLFCDVSEDSIKKILDNFVDKKIAIFVDGKYLALATRSSRYKWKKYNLLHALFEK